MYLGLTNKLIDWLIETERSPQVDESTFHVRAFDHRSLMQTNQRLKLFNANIKRTAAYTERFNLASGIAREVI